MATYLQKECTTHGITKHRFVNYKDGARFRCIECDRIYQLRKRKLLKQKCVDYKGGCCQQCGYNKSNAALDFHHLDPTYKEFNFSKKKVKWETLQKELDKCILVCANCHREIHEKEKAN